MVPNSAGCRSIERILKGIGAAVVDEADSTTSTASSLSASARHASIGPLDFGHVVGVGAGHSSINRRIGASPVGERPGWGSTWAVQPIRSRAAGREQRDDIDALPQPGKQFW
jgi:hypothetical protein